MTDAVDRGRRRDWWLVGLLGLAVGVSFGLSYGDPLSNHPLYLLDGLRRARPGLLSADWFLRDTYQYHVRFSMLVALADRLGGLPWFLALGNVLAVAMDPDYMTFRVRVKCGRCKTVNVAEQDDRTPEERRRRHRAR